MKKSQAKVAISRREMKSSPLVSLPLREMKSTPLGDLGNLGGWKATVLTLSQSGELAKRSVRETTCFPGCAVC